MGFWEAELGHTDRWHVDPSVGATVQRQVLLQVGTVYIEVADSWIHRYAGAHGDPAVDGVLSTSVVSRVDTNLAALTDLEIWGHMASVVDADSGYWPTD